MNAAPPFLDQALRRCAPLFAGSLAALTLFPIPPARALDFYPDGIVCDPGERACYDRSGAAFNETGRRYGSRAERILRRRLGDRPPLQEIRFSSGELCDLRRDLCWDDGSRRTRVSRRLTRHLFGSAAGDDLAFGQRERGCELRRFGVPLFRGRCRLVRLGSDWGADHEVVTDNGRSFRFFDRGNRLWVRDAGGNWPVSVSRRSEGARFRWSSLQLDLDRGCELSQSGRSLYAGGCRLRTASDEGQRTYRVDLDGGRDYRFFTRDDRLWVRDGSGSWPVRTSRNRDELVFAWANRRLAVEHFRWTERPGADSDDLQLRPEQELIRGLLNNVLDGLFR